MTAEKREERKEKRGGTAGVPFSLFPFPSSLTIKIFLGTALVVVAVLGAALLVTKVRADQAADASVARGLKATQSAVSDALAERSRALGQLAAALVKVPAYVSRLDEAIRAGNRADLLDQADELRDQIGAAWVLITDASGTLMAWTERRDLFGEDFARGALIGRALEGRQTEGTWVEPGPAGDLLFQAIGVPLLAPGGGVPFGVLVAAVPVDTGFANLLRRNTGSEVVFFARDTLGTPHVVAATLPRGALRIAEPLRDTAPGRVRLEIQGETWDGAAAPLRTSDGYPVGGYVALRSRDAELGPYRALGQTIGWAFVAGLGLALLSSYVVARRIAEPVEQLAAATREVSQGRYPERIEVQSQDEIGELAKAFGAMLEELREKERLVELLRTQPEPATLAGTAARSDGLLAVGSCFAGRYQIQSVLGSGGMGIVYRAFDTELQETIAIKALRPEFEALDPTLVERFKQELRLARRITHRNVVRTYDLGEVKGTYYITMEFVEGRTVADLIRSTGKLPVPVALTIGKQLCRALEVAHDEGIVHRDVKPQNLLVDPNGFLKVMDFGIARLLERRTLDGGTLTAAGAVVGTPHYMAPEQLFGEPVDARTDIYAAGAVLFECLTGQPVFDAPSLTALVARHVAGASPRDPRQLNPDLSEALSTVVLKAVAPRPADRWQSAGELLHALEGIST